jgi:hypothetical protein
VRETDKLTTAIYSTFSQSGLPLHYEVAAQSVWSSFGIDLRNFAPNNPDRVKAIKKVYRKIRSHPELFERVSPGVYQLRKSIPEQTYQEAPKATNIYRSLVYPL